MSDVKVGRNVKLRKTIVEIHAILPDGLCVGFDPVLDHKRGFRITAQGVTVITPEALGQRVHRGLE